MSLNRLEAALDDGVVRLRPWTYGDLECVRDASLDASIPAVTTVPAQYSNTAGREFIERQWDRTDSGQGWSLAIADAATDRALGCAVLMLRPQAGVAGIGYWLVPRERRLGYGSRAVALLTAWGLAQSGMERIEAWVEPGNVASTRLLERCGYVLEGRLRSFLSLPTRRTDALVFSRLRTDSAE
jgi:ribosomal-protein-alanine N-acetyltransferase